MTEPKVAIGTVHPDMIDAQFCRCLADTLSGHTRTLLPFREPVLMARAPAGMIHVARNEIVRAFLAHPLSPSHLLFIDTDVTWTPEQLAELATTATTNDLPVLSGLLTLGPGDEKEPKRIPMLYDERVRYVPVSADIQRVFCTGMGFMLLRRDALQACLANYTWPTPWFDYGHRNGKAVSEDVVFCERLAELDIPVHVDTRIHLGHRKLFAFTPEETCAPV